MRPGGKKLFLKSAEKDSSEPILLPEFVRENGLRQWNTAALQTVFYLNFGLNIVC